jgi:Tol biopolymer transport system component
VNKLVKAVIWAALICVRPCFCLSNVKIVGVTEGQDTWTTVANLGAISDETVATPLFNSDAVGNVITVTLTGNYTLAENINYPILIQTSHVALDLNSHTITDATANDNIITCTTALTDVSVYNGYLTNTGGSGTGSGIYIASGCSRVQLHDLMIAGTHAGIHVAGLDGVGNDVSGVDVRNTYLMSGDIGMLLEYATGLTARNCYAFYSIQSGFELSNCQANYFYDCTALKITGTATAAGFKSIQGTSNMFQRCVVKQAKTSSTTFGDKACGFLLTGTEQKTKIVTCIVNETDVVSSPTAVTFGIQLAPVIQPTADLLSTVTVWTNQATNAFAVAWSPSGEYLAVIYRDGTLIQVYRFTGTGLTLVTSATPSAQPASLTWSPDGKYLAIGQASATNIVVYSFNGQALTSAASYSGGTGARVYTVAWSPNGKYIAYTDAAASGNVGIVSFDGTTISLVSSQAMSLTLNLGFYASWAPDGSALAIVNDSTLVVLTVIPVNACGQMGTAVTLSTGVSLNGVKWSPNGKYFAVAADSAQAFYVYRWSPTSSSPIMRVASISTGTVCTAVEWSPDGNYIAAAADTSFTIGLYQFTGTGLSLLKTSVALTAVIRNISWTADGRYIAASSITTASQFMVLTAMYGPLNCLVDNGRVCDTLASNQNMGRGLVMGGTNVCTRTVAANNGVNYSYGIPNVYDGRFEITRNVVQPCDNMSMPATL